MTQRKEDTFTALLNNGKVPSSCWWSDEVLSPADPNSNTLYRDFVLISEFSELEGPLPLAVVANSTYIDLKHYTDFRNKEEGERASEFARSSLQEGLKKIGLEYFDFNAFVLRVVSVDRSSEYEQIDEELMEPITPSSVFADESNTPPCLFSIPDDTQVYFTDSEHKFFAFTHHLTLFDINARGYVHPVALSYITRDPDKIMIRFEELMERFNEVSIKMKKGNFSNFTLDLKCRLLDLEYTESNVSTQQKPTLSIQAIKQAITATKLMIDTIESSISQMNSNSTTAANTVDVITDIVDTAADSTTNKDTVSANTATASPPPPLLVEKKKEHTVDPPKDYKPKCIDSLYPVPHFERKLRSLAQLCQEPDEERENTEEPCSHQHMKKPSLTQKTVAMIPLVFSIIESQQPQESDTTTNNSSSSTGSRPTLAHAIKHDMYSEAIKSIQDMTHILGKSSVVLDVNEEERSFIDPVASALTFGRTFMLNMDNPQPREEEKDTVTDGETIPNNNTIPLDEKADTNVRKEEETRENKKEADESVANQYSSSSAQETEDDDDSYYPISLAPAQLWKSLEKTPSHLLEVLKRYQSLIVDVIFSLLTGRTVLIQGSHKEKVQQVVEALSVFVPGQSRHRHQIIDWFDNGRLTDIGSIKLVGIGKEKMDSSIHIEGSCVLDIDVKNGSLQSSPVYMEGQWINQFLDRIMLFSSDESYLAYLHTVFMTMSLKAFVYHHLYVCDEFKLLDEETPSTSFSIAKGSGGYISETNSESSTLSRKWSVRLLNYLKKHEDQEQQEATLSRPPSRTSSVTSTHFQQHPQPQQQQQQQEHQQQEQRESTEEEDRDYSEDNQATVTLQMLQQKVKQQQERPRTIVGLFGSATSSVVGEPVTTTLNATGSSHIDTRTDRRDSLSTFFTAASSRKNSTDSSEGSHSPRHLSDDEEEGYGPAPHTMEGSLMNFGPEDLDYFGEQHSGSSSSSEEEEERESRRRGGRHNRRRKLSDIGPDGISYSERRGRRYLQEKLKVYGDDQTIVVYLATCVL